MSARIEASNAAPEIAEEGRNMYTSKFYRASPVMVQEALIGLRSWIRSSMREGAPLAAALEDVEASQWLNAEAMQDLQFKKLRSTLKTAMRDVPYYRDLYGRFGVEPEELRAPEDLARLPFLTKTDVLAAKDRMLSEADYGKRYESTSSGTTGSFIVGYRDLNSIVREHAFIWRQLKWAGVKLGERRVWLRGDKIVPSTQQTGSFWRHNVADNCLMCSSYHISEERVPAYMAAILKFDPVCIQAYPAGVVMLASVLDARGQRYAGKSLRAIVTSSETISAAQRKLLERVFGCPVYDWYGSFERIAAIGTCEHLRYHLLSDYSYTELIPVDEGRFEVAGTTFDNALMPWIRYRMNDLVVPERSNMVCACGRAFPIIRSIEGRSQDYLLAAGGRRIMMPVNAFDDISGLLEGQFVQHSIEVVDVLCRPSPGITLDPLVVERAVRNYVGTGLKVNVHIVDKIERTSSGKHRSVIRTVENAPFKNLYKNT